MSEPTPAPRPVPGPPTCDHPDGCRAPATHQTQRPATLAEAVSHWNNVERRIREHGNPDYVQNRDDTVTIAGYRCDHPDHADPTYLQARDNLKAAMRDDYFTVPEPGRYHVGTGMTPHLVSQCTALGHHNPPTTEELAAVDAHVQQLGGYAAPITFTTDEHGVQTPHWPTA